MDFDRYRSMSTEVQRSQTKSIDIAHYEPNATKTIGATQTNIR